MYGQQVRSDSCSGVGASCRISGATRLLTTTALIVVLTLIFPSGGVHSQSTQVPDKPFDLVLLAASGSTKLGISYMGMLAVDDGPRTRDYDYLASHGFKLIRIWATWSGPARGGGYGSLVTSTGEIRGGASGEMQRRFVELLRKASENGWKIDVTFDVAEFKAIGGTSYDSYKKAIQNVVYVANAYNTNVIIDVCNECVNAKKVPSDGQEFLSLRKLSGGGGDWVTRLRELLDIPRAQNYALYGIPAFFSMRGVGDPDNKPSSQYPEGGNDEKFIKQAAKYYDQVYAAYSGKRMPPYLAPHYGRLPCPDAWADRVRKRIKWLYDYGNAVLQNFGTYLQEENRRGTDDCCVNQDPCPSVQPQSTQMPQVTGCSSWPGYSGCKKSCDTVLADFQKSAEGAKAKGAYAWVFHTYAGGGCILGNQLQDNFDPEEKKVAEQAAGWLP